jgi:hypothetical protein
VHALNECIETQYGQGNGGFAALSPAVLQNATFSLAAPRAFANCECTDAGSNTATAEENPMLRHLRTLAHHCRPADLPTCRPADLPPILADIVSV